MGSRRRARGTALQVLYELDCTSHKAEEVLARLVYDEEVSEDDYDFIADLVRGVLEHSHEIDTVIAQHAPAFPVDQMAIVDRNVLRIALFELLYTDDTPLKVAINEAVELAKLFGADSTPRLVNGVLGAVADGVQDEPDTP